MTIRVLVADDIPMIRIGFVTALNAQPDIEVVAEAASGDEAVAIARQIKPDVVVMDISMPPGMDGIEATSRIRAANGDRTAVLIQTTYDEDENIYDALAVGASGFLEKTVSLVDLVKAVRVIAAGEALVSPKVTKRLIEQNFLDRPRSTGPERAMFKSLTAREKEVLVLVADGQDNGEIAETLFISTGTVKTHVSNMMDKLKLSTRIRLVIFAYEAGLVRPGRSHGRPNDQQG
jgi:DNA-binding NarL/FixJ family response regulator